MPSGRLALICGLKIGAACFLKLLQMDFKRHPSAFRLKVFICFGLISMLDFNLPDNFVKLASHKITIM